MKRTTASKAVLHDRTNTGRKTCAAKTVCRPFTFQTEKRSEARRHKSHIKEDEPPRQRRPATKRKSTAISTSFPAPPAKPVEPSAKRQRRTLPPQPFHASQPFVFSRPQARPVPPRTQPSQKLKFDLSIHLHVDGKASITAEAGFCVIKPGDSFHDGRYYAVTMLGTGAFSSVWLMYDKVASTRQETHFVAVKVHRTTSRHDSLLREVNLLAHITDRAGKGAPLGLDRFVCSMQTHFVHTDKVGKHVCMVFPVLGAYLLDIIQQRSSDVAHRRGKANMPLVLDIFESILYGVEHIQNYQMVHTDIKPENILLSKPDPTTVKIMKAFCAHNRLPEPAPHHLNTEPLSLTDPLHRKFPSSADQGLSRTPVRSLAPHFDVEHATREVSDTSNRRATMKRKAPDSPNSDDTSLLMPKERSPPVILADFGNAGLLARNKLQLTDVDVYENTNIARNNIVGITLQTREYRAPEIILGQDFNDKIDNYSVACVMIEVITGNYLWDPKFTVQSYCPQKTEEDIDKEHLQHIVSVIGDDQIPRFHKRRARYKKRYFTEGGQLIAARLKTPSERPIATILKDHVPEHVLDPLSHLLTAMLALHPDDRPSTAACLARVKEIKNM
eukprot:TRINITY_DN66737_c6_g1_i1.p1 TRINITY_DN66737_c6_g1~~TRINITY_DN66737_c6_g1_i1.p1  ORF type:complete len:613 (+),score=48.29 TRINITY_DN66737_c6_g1_i1:40-1878(+)